MATAGDAAGQSLTADEDAVERRDVDDMRKAELMQYAAQVLGTATRNMGSGGKKTLGAQWKTCGETAKTSRPGCASHRMLRQLVLVLSRCRLQNLSRPGFASHRMLRLVLLVLSTCRQQKLKSPVALQASTRRNCGRHVDVQALLPRNYTDIAICGRRILPRSWPRTRRLRWNYTSRVGLAPHWWSRMRHTYSQALPRRDAA